MKKNILIIGGSYGIGLEVAKDLSAKHNITVASRTNENLSNLDVHYVQFDVLQDHINDADIPDEIHGLVYCPGSINLRPFKGLKPSIFENDFQLNVMGAIRVIQALLPRFKSEGSIVLYSTVAVKIGMPFHASVATAKGALEGLAKSLAAELAPKIRVNVIAPSITQTPLANRFLNNELKIEKSAQRHPLKRIGKAQDIAYFTSFLLSDHSSWMTGQIIGLDGGISSLNTH